MVSEDIAVTNFREYLRIRTEQPNPDYGSLPGCYYLFLLIIRDYVKGLHSTTVIQLFLIFYSIFQNFLYYKFLFSNFK